jgi:large subunit ribosomal protein L24
MVRIQSTQPRKQRKGRYNAPLHQKGKFLSAPLSAELQSQYDRRSVRVVQGDTVKMLRGDLAGEEGVVDEISTRNNRLYVHGVSVTKADGTEVPRPVDPSNVQVIKLNLKDSIRAERLGGSE